MAYDELDLTTADKLILLNRPGVLSSLPVSLPPLHSPFINFFCDSCLSQPRGLFFYSPGVISSPWIFDRSLSWRSWCLIVILPLDFFSNFSLITGAFPPQPNPLTICCRDQFDGVYQVPPPRTRHLPNPPLIARFEWWTMRSWFPFSFVLLCKVLHPPPEPRRINIAPFTLAFWRLTGSDRRYEHACCRFTLGAIHGAFSYRFMISFHPRWVFFPPRLLRRLMTCSPIFAPVAIFYDLQLSPVPPESLSFLPRSNSSPPPSPTDSPSWMKSLSPSNFVAEGFFSSLPFYYSQFCRVKSWSPAYRRPIVFPASFFFSVESCVVSFRSWYCSTSQPTPCPRTPFSLRNSKKCFLKERPSLKTWNGNSFSEVSLLPPFEASSTFPLSLLFVIEVLASLRYAPLFLSMSCKLYSFPWIKSCLALPSYYFPHQRLFLWSSVRSVSSRIRAPE